MLCQLEGLEVFYGPEGPRTLQVIQVGQCAVDRPGLFVDHNTRYEQKVQTKHTANRARQLREGYRCHCMTRLTPSFLEYLAQC